MDGGPHVGELLGSVLLVAAAVGACRDAPELHEPAELPPLGPAPYRLTYDPGRDVAPTWSASGDSIIYVTEEVLPPHPGTGEDSVRTGRPLRVIHREGSVAERVFPLLQPGTVGTTPVDYAAQSSSGRIAAFTLLPPLPAALCFPATPTCSPELQDDGPPRLDAGILRVRTPGAGDDPDADPRIVVEFPGREFDTTQNPGGLDGVWQVETHPFQRQFNIDRRAPSKMSWHPDGNRLVFSNGVSLFIWNPSTDAVTPIPGTMDGVNPAWSPTGDWIAFERYERGPLTEATCEHLQFGELRCAEQRRSWPLTGRNIARIRPDGSDLQVLTPGARPAWGADEQRIYYERDRRIWSVGVDGDGAGPVDGTAESFWPAVSPDGRWLAFARFDSVNRVSDIWVVELKE